MVIPLIRSIVGPIALIALQTSWSSDEDRAAQENRVKRRGCLFANPWFTVGVSRCGFRFESNRYRNAMSALRPLFP